MKVSTTIILAVLSGGAHHTVADKQESFDNVVDAKGKKRKLRGANHRRLALHGCPQSNYANSAFCTASWRLNQVTTNPEILDLVTEVQSVKVQDNPPGSPDYFQVTTAGIPEYEVEVTQELLDELNARPSPTTDFANGVGPTVQVGDTITFGQDIGYSSPKCITGYWPPGPVSHEILVIRLCTNIITDPRFIFDSRVH